MIIKEYDFFHIFDFNTATTGVVKPKKYKTKENEMINLVSGDTDNNGISFFVKKIDYPNKIQKNCFTMSTRGEYCGTMYYQNDDFVNSNTCMILKLNSQYLKYNNKYIGLYISSVWNKIKKYGGYSNYPTKNISLKLDKIPLPSILNNNGEYEPDWQYIENYIKVIEKNILINESPKNKTIKFNSCLQKYKIEDLFEVKTSKFHNPNKLSEGKTPYVSRTTFNNGIDRFINTDGIVTYPGNCLIIGAESAMAFYQKDSFITGNKIYRIYSKNNNKLNKYIALYICTILNQETSKYSYSNAWISEKVKETQIYLPSILNNNGEYEPDWQYIEDYVKSLPYSSSI